MTLDGTERIELRGAPCVLLPEGAIYLPESGALLFSDLHIGKTAHFRKHGFAVPSNAASNLLRLQAAVVQWKPQRLICLGDLFHSDYNAEVGAFVQWLQNDSIPPLELVAGNHDILPDTRYAGMGIRVYRGALPLPPFSLQHHPPESGPDDAYVLHGHLHPGIWLQGAGKQQLRLPCFHFGAAAGCLPAFGLFTGLAAVGPQPGDRIFALTGDAVVEVA